MITTINEYKQINESVKLETVIHATATDTTINDIIESLVDWYFSYNELEDNEIEYKSVKDKITSIITHQECQEIHDVYYNAFIDGGDSDYAGDLEADAYYEWVSKNGSKIGLIVESKK